MKVRGSVVAALLQQPEVLKDAYQDAQAAEGSAIKENEKYMESIQGHVDQFQNAVQTMWQDEINKDTIKFFVDLGTQLVKLIDKFGLIETIVIGFLAKYMFFVKKGKLDLAQMLGIHDLEKGWFPDEGVAKKFFKSIWSGIKTTGKGFQWLGKFIWKGFKWIGKESASLSKVIVKTFSPQQLKSSNLFSKISELISNLSLKFKTTFGNIGKFINNAFVKMTSRSYYEESNGWLKRAEIVKPTKTKSSTTNNAVTPYNDPTASISKWESLLQKIQGKFLQFKYAIQDFGSTLFDKALASLQNFATNVTTVFGKVKQTISNNMGTMFNNISKTYNNISMRLKYGKYGSYIDENGWRRRLEILGQQTPEGRTGTSIRNNTVNGSFVEDNTKGIEGKSSQQLLTDNKSNNQLAVIESQNQELANITDKTQNSLFAKFRARISNWYSNFTSFIGNLKTSMTGTIQSWNISITKFTTTTAQKFTALKNNISQSLSGAFTNAIGTVKQFSTSVQIAFNNIKLSISNLFSNGMSNVTNGIQNITNKLSTSFDNLKLKANNAFVKATSRGQYLIDENGRYQKYEIQDTRLTNPEPQEASWISRMTTKFKKSDLGVSLSNTFNNAKTSVRYFAESVDNALYRMRYRIGEIKDSLSNAFTSAVGAVKKFIAPAQAAFTNLKLKINDAFARITNNGLFEKIKQSIISMVNSISVAFKNLGAQINTTFNGIKGGFSNFAGKFKGGVSNFFKGKFSRGASSSTDAASDVTTGSSNLPAVISPKSVQQSTDALSEYNGEVDNTTKALVPYNNNTGLAVQGTKDLGTESGNAAPGVDKLGKSVSGLQHLLANIGIMMLISGIMKLLSAIGDLIKKGLDPLYTSFEEQKEEFENLSNELQSTETTLSSLESQLEDIEGQIEDIQDLGTLEFSDLEDLERLKEESAELERQIALQKTLKEQQQIGVNESAVATADKYYQTGEKTGKTSADNLIDKSLSGASIGAMIGAGLVLATGVLSGIFTAGTSTAASIGIAAAILGGSTAVGAGVGAGVAGIQNANDTTVADTLANRKERQAELQTKYDEAVAKWQSGKGDYEDVKKASEELAEFQKTVADDLSYLQSVANEIDWDTASEEAKKTKIEIENQLDANNIDVGGENAKENAITRLFGDEAFIDDTVTTAVKNAKEAYIKALDEGKEISLEDAFGDNTTAFQAFKENLYAMGLYVADAERYLVDFKEAEEEAAETNLYDLTSSTVAAENAMSSLASAFEEASATGQITAKTIKELNETFGSMDSIADEWQNYVNVMMSGVASTKEMQEATQQLAEAWLDNAFIDGPMELADKVSMIASLTRMGVTNAVEYVEDAEKEAGYTKIADTIKSKMNRRDELEAKGEDRTDEEDSELVQLNKDLDLKNPQNLKYLTELADQYGITTDELVNYIDTLEKLAEAEKDLDEQNKKQSDYDEFTDKYKKAKEIMDDNAAGKDFDPNSWTATIPDGEGNFYYISSDHPDEKLTREEFERRTEAAKLYKEAEEELKKIKEEGKEKGYIDDNGNIVNIDFQANVDKAEAKVEELKNKIETELTANIQLKLDLQNKSQLVDDIQSVFDDLSNAVKEYNENGYFSVDTVQKLLEMEPKYLTLLQDENGNLNLNKNAMYEVAKARLTDLGIQAKQNILETASTTAKDGSVEAMRELTDATYKGVSADELAIETKIALIKATLKQRQEDELLKNGKTDITDSFINNYIGGIRKELSVVDKVVSSANTNMANAISSSGNSAEDTAKDAYDKAMKYWENRISANQAKYEQIQNEIDLLKKQGKIAGESYYQEQINLENERMSLLKQQQEEAKKYMNTFKKGSDNWIEAAKQCNDIEGEIDDVIESIQSLQDAIGEIHWTVFDEAHDRFSDLTGQLSAIRELLSIDEDTFFDEFGNWTEQGVAALATYIQELEITKSALDDVNKELSTIKIGDFDSEQEYYDRVSELKKQQQDYAKSIADSKKSVVEMYEKQTDALEEYSNKAVDAYKELIDLKKKELDAEKDLYSFKKSTEEKTKNIGELERKIASLSGSTAASDIAQRRKLEAELRSEQEELAENYYDHAKSAQSDALDDEADAFEKSQEDYIKKLKETLDEAKKNMDTFLEGVTASVMLNAGTIEEQYQATGLSIDAALVTPWQNAAVATQAYADTALSMMNQWTTDAGFFGQFKSSASNQLATPWAVGTVAAKQFQSDSSTVMSNIVANIKSNVATASGQLTNLYNQIVDTQKKAAEGATFTTTYKTVYETEGTPPQNPTNGHSTYMQYIGTADRQIIVGSASYFNSQLQEINGVKYYKGSDGHYYPSSYAKTVTYDGGRSTGIAIPKGTPEYRKYAKGTTGTKKDQWAITDEYGPELTMYATPEGTLSYMRVGSTVVPADETKKILEMVDNYSPNMLNDGIIRPAINNVVTNNNSSICLNFDSFINAENISDATMEDLDKMVSKKIDEFSRKLNYALKRV